MKTTSLGAYRCKGGKGRKSEVDGEEGGRGPDVNHMNYTTFISEYSGAIERNVLAKRMIGIEEGIRNRYPENNHISN